MHRTFIVYRVDHFIERLIDMGIAERSWSWQAGVLYLAARYAPKD